MDDMRTVTVAELQLRKRKAIKLHDLHGVVALDKELARRALGGDREAREMDPEESETLEDVTREALEQLRKETAATAGILRHLDGKSAIEKKRLLAAAWILLGHADEQLDYVLPERRA